jgi:plasmid stabilization system protein ParE
VQRVWFHEAAEREVDEAFEWYREQSRAAAAGFLDALHALQGRIGANPMAFPLTRNALRKAVMARYPYVLLFREKGRGVEVLVVAHAKREPGYWAGREA